MNLTTVLTEECPSYYYPFIASLNTRSLIAGLEESKAELVAFMQAVPLDKQDYAYAKGKWTIKDVLLHSIDVERIFSYRALRFSRGDNQELMGFDHNAYVNQVDTAAMTMADLLEDYKAVRTATIRLFKSLTKVQLQHMGVASGNAISVRALGFILIGHQQHHLRIISERYL